MAEPFGFVVNLSVSLHLIGSDVVKRAKLSILLFASQHLNMKRQHWYLVGWFFFSNSMFIFGAISVQHSFEESLPTDH